MGINCKCVHKVIHFGPSVDVERYVQECGRAGRDGKKSICVLLHNSLLSSHCSDDMEVYLSSEKCRRMEILKLFPGKRTTTVKGCGCCDSCATTCACAGHPGECRSSMFLKTSMMEIEEYQFKKSITVSDNDKSLLNKKLVHYMNELRKNSVKLVLYPNMFF